MCARIYIYIYGNQLDQLGTLGHNMVEVSKEIKAFFLQRRSIRKSI